VIAPLILGALLVGASAPVEQDRVLGLVSLPEVFGNGPCHPFEPGTVSLFASPNAAMPIAVIQVDQQWSFAPHGGCEGLKVSVHRDRATAELPTREYANESPAAIVLEARDGWFKIRLATGAGWLRPSTRARFMPLADLFSEYPTLTAITDAHSGPLREEPDGVASAPKSASPGAPVRVLELRQRGAQTWLHVAVMSHSVCEAAAGPPEVVGLGWVPAHAPSGEPTVWFSSRGC
jgi:hypothetical protein